MNKKAQDASDVAFYVLIEAARAVAIALCEKGVLSVNDPVARALITSALRLQVTDPDLEPPLSAEELDEISKAEIE